MSGVGPGTGSREGLRGAPGANEGAPAPLQTEAQPSPAQLNPDPVTNPVASPSELTIPATDVARGLPRTIQIEIDPKVIGIHAISAQRMIEEIVQDSLNAVRRAIISLEPGAEAPVITISGLAGLERQRTNSYSSDVIATQHLEDWFLVKLQAALLKHQIRANVDLNLNAFPNPKSGDQFLLRQEFQRDPLSYDIIAGSDEKSVLVISAQKVPASDTQSQTSPGFIAWFKSLFSKFV